MQRCSYSLQCYAKYGSIILKIFSAQLHSIEAESKEPLLTPLVPALTDARIMNRADRIPVCQISRSIYEFADSSTQSNICHFTIICTWKIDSKLRALCWLPHRPCKQILLLMYPEIILEAAFRGWRPAWERPEPHHSTSAKHQNDVHLQTFDARKIGDVKGPNYLILTSIAWILWSSFSSFYPWLSGQQEGATSGLERLSDSGKMMWLYGASLCMKDKSNKKRWEYLTYLCRKCDRAWRDRCKRFNGILPGQRQLRLRDILDDDSYDIWKFENHRKDTFHDHIMIVGKHCDGNWIGFTNVGREKDAALATHASVCGIDTTQAAHLLEDSS